MTGGTKIISYIGLPARAGAPERWGCGAGLRLKRPHDLARGYSPWIDVSAYNDAQGRPAGTIESELSGLILPSGGYTSGFCPETSARVC